MVSSNPLTELGCGVFAVIANTMHIANLKDEMLLYDASTKGVRNDRDKNIQTCFNDENQKKVYEARAQYIWNKDLGVWPKDGKIEYSPSYYFADEFNFFGYAFPSLFATCLGSLFTLGTGLRLGFSDPLPITTSTINLVAALPMRYTITRGQYRLNQAQKQAATITKATVQGYQDYLNPSEEAKNPFKKDGKEMDGNKVLDFCKQNEIQLLNDNDLSTMAEEENALLAARLNGNKVSFSSQYNMQDFPEVHRTNFAEQAKGNILIAKDQELNTAFWDNFGSKKCRWGLNWENLQNFRESVQPQKALADDDTHRKTFGDHRVANKIFRVQGKFNSLRHDILDPAKAEENDANFQASQYAYEAGEYFQKKYRTSLK